MNETKNITFNNNLHTVRRSRENDLSLKLMRIKRKKKSTVITLTNIKTLENYHFKTLPALNNFFFKEGLNSISLDKLKRHVYKAEPLYGYIIKRN